MDLWMKIGWAVLMGLMVVFIWPRARHMLQNSREASTGEWMGALVPIALVGLFIVLLVMMV